ncbi:MAG: DNA mismatch repair endonuclease MutL [Haloarculaceae archaeon]
MRIQQLDARTVERIAAGEVVERPASVVKELVENALDADASRVEVAVEAGGTEGIRVRDDGVGMAEPEVRRAVEEHTTSKIGDIDDLESGVGTLGFRGEALHAIGAVSRMTVTTRPRADANATGTAGTPAADADRGTELVVEGGEVTSVEPAGCPAGTTVEVADLFYNVPARRKYLKQPSTEFGHVNRVVTGYALANPDVAVSLSHDGRETFATTGRGDRRAAVMAVYGREVAAAMIPVRAESTGESDAGAGSTSDLTLPEGPLDGVRGLVSHPETTRASRDYLSTFVNGRYVTASAVRDAVVEGYGNQLAGDRYPFAVLSLSVDPATVDVNVHPRKLEVRFADEAGVREQVRHAVRETLLSEGLIRSRAPRGRSAPEQTEVRPGDTEDETAPDGAEGASRAGDRTDGERPVRTEPMETTTDPHAAADTQRSPDPSAEPDGDPTGDSAADAGARDANVPRDRKFEPAHGQRRLGDAAGADDADNTGGAVGDPDDAREFDRLPPMRVLGQFRETYVVAETPDGLVLVDQHAADERVNYERLRAAFADGPETQALAEPVELEVTAAERAAAEAHGEALARLGFRVEAAGDRTVALRSVPALLAEDGPEVLPDLLADLAGGRDPADTVEAVADDLLADLACYPSVTGNTSLTEGSVVDLLERLDACENPYACPHGRPVVVEFDDDELEARFERDYPGHGG